MHVLVAWNSTAARLLSHTGHDVCTTGDTYPRDPLHIPGHIHRALALPWDILLAFPPEPLTDREVDAWTAAEIWERLLTARAGSSLVAVPDAPAVCEILGLKPDLYIHASPYAPPGWYWVKGDPLSML